MAIYLGVLLPPQPAISEAIIAFECVGEVSCIRTACSDPADPDVEITILDGGNRLLFKTTTGIREARKDQAGVYLLSDEEGLAMLSISANQFTIVSAFNGGYWQALSGSCRQTQ